MFLKEAGENSFILTRHTSSPPKLGLCLEGGGGQEWTQGGSCQSLLRVPARELPLQLTVPKPGGLQPLKLQPLGPGLLAPPSLCWPLPPCWPRPRVGPSPRAPWSVQLPQKGRMGHTTNPGKPVCVSHWERS